MPYGYGPYRVPIDVGEGWELVPEKEHVRAGDEFLVDRNWEPLGCGWFGERVAALAGNPVRRRKPSAPKREQVESTRDVLERILESINIQRDAHATHAAELDAQIDALDVVRRNVHGELERLRP
jgi:hypothetical protein